MHRRLLTTLLAITIVAMVAGGLLAGSGLFKRAYDAPGGRVTSAEINNVAAYASHAVQKVLYNILQTGTACYGGTLVAGTGFDVNASIGFCVYDYSTGATDPVHRFRVVEFAEATQVTLWAANPGAATYYVHCMYGTETRSASGKSITEAPECVTDTNASLAGYLTIGNVVVGGGEPDATTYTYDTTVTSFADRLVNGATDLDAATADIEAIEDALLADGATDDQFDLTDLDAAAATGRALYVAPTYLGPLCTLNADNSDGNADNTALSDDGLTAQIQDNDAAGVGAAVGVVVYFDEDGAAGSKLLAVIPSLKDCYIPFDDGTLLKIKYSAGAAGSGVQIYYDDDGTVTEKMLFVSPTDTDGSALFANDRALIPSIIMP